MTRLFFLFLACAPAPLQLDVTPAEGGLEVRGSRPLARIVVEDLEGRPIVARSLPREVHEVHVPAPLRPGGTYRVRAHAGLERVDTQVELPAVGPVQVEIEAPVGQGRRPLGERVDLIRVDDAEVAVAVHVIATRPGPVTVWIGATEEELPLDAVGQRAVSRVVLGDDGELPIRVDAGGELLTSTLRVESRTREQARAALEVVDVAFPADAFGAVDGARPTDRITLPARWWQHSLVRLGLGYRPRGDQAPWAWQTVTLRNHDSEPLSVVIRAQVHDEHGPAPAFAARVRDGREDSVSVLLRIPAGQQATAVIPVWVARTEAASGTYTRRVEVIPLGASRPLHVVERPLTVTVGSGWASGGFGIAVGASLLGYALLAARGRRWLRERRTSELVTIALFGAITFVVGAVLQVVGMGVAGLLGPFAPLLTGLPDDALRACLLGALVTLIPRPGVVALATVVGFLMRGLTLGSFHPVDLLYLGSAVFWLELCLWLAGPTRLPAWGEASRGERWLRLGFGLGLANVCATASALVVSVVLYRLFFAGWYVAMVLALPGFFYVLLGAAIAVDVAAALRRVQT